MPAVTCVAVLHGLSFTLCCKAERLCCSNTTVAYLVITMPLWLIQTDLIMKGAVAEILALYRDVCCGIIFLLRISGYLKLFTMGSRLI
jgi:hypothetical protein